MTGDSDWWQWQVTGTRTRQWHHEVLDDVEPGTATSVELQGQQNGHSRGQGSISMFWTNHLECATWRVIGFGYDRAFFNKCTHFKHVKDNLVSSSVYHLCFCCNLPQLTTCVSHLFLGTICANIIAETRSTHIVRVLEWMPTTDQLLHRSASY